jgi:hypothetical protein
MTTVTPTIATINSPNWLAEAYNDIQLAANPDGMLGALQNSAKYDGSAASFVNNSSTNADAFAVIAQDNNQTAFSATPPKVAASAYDQAQRAKLMANLSAPPPITPQPLLDPLIFFPDGSMFDTVNNIMTRADGTQIDTTTGAKIFDASSIINLPDGSYLNTKTNILTLPDGTQIDTITGLTVAQEEAAASGTSG